MGVRTEQFTDWGLKCDSHRPHEQGQRGHQQTEITWTVWGWMEMVLYLSPETHQT